MFAELNERSTKFPSICSSRLSPRSCTNVTRDGLNSHVTLSKRTESTVSIIYLTHIYVYTLRGTGKSMNIEAKAVTFDV